MFLLGVMCRVTPEERGVPQITVLEVGVKRDYEGWIAVRELFGVKPARYQ